MSSPDEVTIYKIFSELGISHKTLEHDVVTTMEEGVEIAKKLEGFVPLNLLLKDKKNGKLYLVVKSNDGSKLNFKELENILGVKKLCMAPRDLLQTKLNVPVGSANVFAILNDSSNEIQVLIDKKIPQDGKINFHPMRNNATTTIEFNDMLKYLSYFNKDVKYF